MESCLPAKARRCKACFPQSHFGKNIIWIVRLGIFVLIKKFKVCEGRAAGAHFGVDSCRACAAFFRRTLLSKRIIECASGHCGKPRECKGCRFERCISSGMLPSLVTGEPNNTHEIPSVITSHPNIIFLHRLLVNYKTFTNDRVIFEQSFLKSSPEFKLHPFQNTPPNEQHFLILQNCLFAMHTGEGNYRAARAYSERPLSCFFTSYTTIYRHEDFERVCENYMPQWRAPQIMPKCQETFTEIRDVLVPMFDRLKPTELEFLAAISLAMWLMGSAQINKKIATIAENYRRRVFYELHVLYRDEFKLNDSALRIGELMTLAISMEQAASALINVFRLLDIFNGYEGNKFASAIVAPVDVCESPEDWTY
ncbi:hypothetical protein PRIPAC_78492 [Pristionchus pacificus]|nr:hypothetical protein PRIPAC_78492 [Pristionchus pacificus]